MGKAKASSSSTTSTAPMMMMIKKKKGRPPKTPPIATPKPINGDSRSAPRNPNYCNSDDDDERAEKKVKLVVRLPQFEENSKAQKRSHENEDSGSDSGAEDSEEDRDRSPKKRKINGVDGGSDDAGSVQVKDVESKATESGPTTPLPDKKLLVFILDRLQKKDTHGVFSEPVDLNELPDYLDIVEKPMDFGTMRKKLDGGSYQYLEELEADLFLLCSNAMTYNAPYTVFYRQARSIQELAKRDFENLKHEGENGELQPKVVKRGRPPSNKNPKKSLEKSSIDRVSTDPSSDAALTRGEDKATGSNTYNLRKGPALNRFRPNDVYVSSYQSRNGENHFQSSGGWNDEFPASILRADMKYGKKQQVMVDETRRDTYRQFCTATSASISTIFSSSLGDKPRLVPIGPQDPISYTRSLARYAAKLGPVAWKIASRKIESALPPEVPYGRGWVGDDVATSQPFSFSSEKQKSSNSSACDGNPNKPVTPSTSDLSSAVPHGATEGMIEAVRKLNSQNEVGMHGNASSWRTPFPIQQKPVYHQLQRNGFSGMFGYETPAMAGTGMPTMTGGIDPTSSRSSPLNRVFQDVSQPSESWRNLQRGYPIEQDIASGSHGEAGRRSFDKPSTVMQQQLHNLLVPPDLNVGIPPSGSAGPSHQPDLALQL